MLWYLRFHTSSSQSSKSTARSSLSNALVSHKFPVKDQRLVYNIHAQKSSKNGCLPLVCKQDTDTLTKTTDSMFHIPMAHTWTGNGKSFITELCLRWKERDCFYLVGFKWSVSLGKYWRPCLPRWNAAVQVSGIQVRIFKSFQFEHQLIVMMQHLEF